MTPFAQAAPDLITLGYSPVPLISPYADHGGKGLAPGDWRSGHWAGMSRWQRFRDTGPSGFEMKLWLAAPEANVGVVMGSPAGHASDGTTLHVVGLDFDATDPDVLDALLRAAPASPMRKRGSKGETRFYRAPKEIKSRSYDDADGARLLDVLAGFDTRQTVVPPSISPRTDRPYVWLAGPVAAHDLPVLTPDEMAALEETLEGLGWSRAGTGPRRDRPARPAPDDADDLWSETKIAAMSRLGEWVPKLDLYGLRPARGGFECVETWRPSTTGRPLHARKRNLSIQPDGIKDWGSGNTYSAIDLVMAARDCDQAAATTWLREALGLNDDGVVVALAAPVRVVEVSPGDRRAETSADRLGELPLELTDVPGLVGDIARWMTSTARKPQPVLSLAAALGIVGTIAGRKFAGPTESATHLYFLCLAGTGAGKGAPKKAAGQLLAKAGLRHFLGPGAFQSASALIQHVSSHPASFCIMDEFGVFIGKVNARNNSTHERAISGELRQFHSLSFEQYEPPRWAFSAQRQSIAPISAPGLSIMGLSTPEEMYTVLQGADIDSGFLNRFLLFATSANPPDTEPAASVFEPPSDLVERLQRLAAVGGPLASATMHNVYTDGPMIRVQWADGIGGAAHKVFRDLTETIASRTEHIALHQRTAEMAVRLATARAIGIGGEAATVSADDMQWAADVALWSAARMVSDIEAHLVESEHQRRAKKVLRIIRDHPGPLMTRTELCRRLNNSLRSREIDEVIQGLVEAAQIERVTMKEMGGGTRGRPPSAYRAV
ncbi:MAG: bifunctional DNA primase/polymerase [Caulobacteraceae bacterium]|nr:bifunctional DNA primase/polymerase [Caulobacteraceae bacterium]